MTTATITQQTGVSLPRRDPPRPLCQNAPQTVSLHPISLAPPGRPANLSPAPITPPAAPASPPSQPKLLDRLREALRSRHYSRRTETAYCHWVRRFIFFHHVRHPADMSGPEINAFLTHLAVKEDVSASTQTQALSALLFLYRYVVGRETGELGAVIRARKPRRLPVVMTRDEVKALLRCLDRDRWLMAALMYGAGLRLMECVRLRVQDLDFERNEIMVRDGKGAKDRRTMLPESLKVPPPRLPANGQSASRAGSCRRLGAGPDARRPGPQVPQCSRGLALAVGLPAGAPVEEHQGG